jgi:hypothetical protein
MPPNRPERRSQAAETAKTLDVIFILRKRDDRYTEGMTKYVRTTLQGHEYKEIANIEEISAYARELAAKGVKPSEVRIIGHGQTTIGGVGMTPRWREEVAVPVAGRGQGLHHKAGGQGDPRGDGTGRTDRVLGCYVGGIQNAGDAWAGLFNATVRSTKGEMRVGTETFKTNKGVATKVSDVTGEEGPSRVQRLAVPPVRRSPGRWGGQGSLDGRGEAHLRARPLRQVGWRDTGAT